jgi:uncharacterized protein YjbJ (UPF0337 family)
MRGTIARLASFRRREATPTLRIADMADDRGVGAVRNIGGKIQETMGDLAGDAATKVRGKVNKAAGRTQNAVGGAADEFSAFGDMVGDAVRERPLVFLVLSLGVGVLIGLCMRR